MHFRTLGKTGIRVSLMSYGGGGPSRLGQSTGLTEDEQDRLIQRYLDKGVNLFDTSAGYGDSEIILGRGLKKSGVARDEYTIVTKWSPNRDPGNENPEELRASVEASLERIGVEVIDVFLLHGVLPEYYDRNVEIFYPMLETLRDEGKIRFLGFSERFHTDPAHKMAEHALQAHPHLWDAIMLKYGILNQGVHRLALPLCVEHNIGVMNMSAVRSKLSKHDELVELMRDWRQRGLIPADAVEEDDPLGWLARDGVESVVAAGYKFGADEPGISTVVTGSSRIENLEANYRALQEPRLPDADKERLRKLFGHLNEGA